MHRNVFIIEIMYDIYGCYLFICVDSNFKSIFIAVVMLCCFQK